MAETRLITLYEDFLDDLQPDTQDAARKVVNNINEPDIVHDKDEYTHTMRITMRPSGRDDKKDVILPLKDWFEFLNDRFDGFQLFDKFFIGRIRIEDANHSGNVRRQYGQTTQDVPDDFSEDFYAPFPDEFNISQFYKDKDKSTWNMCTYFYIDVWFTPSDRMPFRRFMNNYFRFSSAVYRYINSNEDISNTISFAFYDNSQPDHSISTFTMNAGSITGLNKPLEILYRNIYDQDFVSEIAQYDDRLARRMMLKLTERLDDYVLKMMQYALSKHRLRLEYKDKWNGDISDWETLNRYSKWTTSQPTSAKILAFMVYSADGAKEINMSAVEDTVITGFMARLPQGAQNMFNFAFVMQIQAKFVDDCQRERDEKLASGKLRYTEVQELKKNRNQYNGHGLNSAYTEADEMYNDENSKRKAYWRVRKGTMNKSYKEFLIVCPDKNGNICRAQNESLSLFGDFRSLWKRICDMINWMNI